MGRDIRMMTLLDEFTRKCLAPCVERSLMSAGVKNLFIEPGSPWESNCIKSFKGRLREELLNGGTHDTSSVASTFLTRTFASLCCLTASSAVES